MAKRKEAAASADSGAEPTEAELAACALVVELLRSGRIVTYIGDILVERVVVTDHPGEPPEAVVIRRFCELVVPVLSGEREAAGLWEAARLIESIREQMVDDFRGELGGWA